MIFVDEIVEAPPLRLSGLGRRVDSSKTLGTEFTDDPSYHGFTPWSQEEELAGALVGSRFSKFSGENDMRSDAVSGMWCFFVSTFFFDWMFVWGVRFYKTHTFDIGATGIYEPGLLLWTPSPGPKHLFKTNQWFFPSIFFSSERTYQFVCTFRGNTPNSNTLWYTFT